MPDWREQVRRRLPPISVSPERDAEVVAELALQMEQAYADALASGGGEAEAERRARAPCPDWRALARESENAEAPRARWWAGAGRELRLAARDLGRHPAFAAIAIAT